MFDALAERLTAVFQRLRGKGSLTESDVAEGLREIRLALLEADVNYKVVKELVERIRARAVGADVMESLTPGQQLLKIVRDELAETMGGERTALRLDRRPSVVMLVGLQGSGKTTTAAKLANLLKHEGRKPVLVAADVYRPAAIDQLEQLGRDLDIPVVSRTDPNPVKIASGAVSWARQHLRDVVLIDTAGRLQIDDEMMREIAEIAEVTNPVEKLLVADAMTGQEAVAVATAFNERVALTGVILSKTDGDARGGAALSIRHATGCPIVYRRDRGKGRRAGAVPPAAHGRTDPRDGRRPHAHRAGRGAHGRGQGRAVGREHPQEPLHAPGLPRAARGGAQAWTVVADHRAAAGRGQAERERDRRGRG